ncbi:hypothetical protein NQ318_018478 [Aromia moschata]|uniref:Zinc finger CW-type PWWP domain protein 1 n=1 Tax=Aromia moschata TaxID=1265417 RepID=A0AAV8YMI2_9CUCU|nr:hypothetical protein NQ318_018478 [Aromia moschata]
MVPEQNKIKVTQRKRKYMLNSSSDKSLNEPLTIKKNKNGMKKKNRTIKRIVTDEESLISQNENIEKTNQKRKRKYIRSSNAETVKEALVFNKKKHKKNFESRIKRSSLKKIPTDDDSNKNLTLDEKMSLIRESRNVGLYVLCDICNKARYLPHVKDPLDLPDKWYCAMNPDDAHNKCSDPEKADEDEEYLIENLYNAGSVVWAKMDGYPWWPAMVEDDPDVEDYFWLEDNSMKPTWYHVTFFDSEAVTRAWIRPSNLKPFKVNMNNPQFQTPARNKYKSRVNVAFEQACDAIELQLIDRLKKYTFMNRYNKSLKQRESQNNSNNVKNKRKRRDQPGNSLVGRQIASDQNMQPCNTKSTEVATLENGKNSDISMVLNEINWGEAQNISFNLFD